MNNGITAGKRPRTPLVVSFCRSLETQGHASCGIYLGVDENAYLPVDAVIDI